MGKNITCKICEREVKPHEAVDNTFCSTACKYKGKFVCVSKDHKYYNIGNAAFNIKKGQVSQHPGYELEPEAFEIFDTEKQAHAYCEKYKAVLVPEVRGTKALGGTDKGITTKPVDTGKEPKKPNMDDVIENARQVDEAGTPGSKLTSDDITNLLDQNGRTVISRIRKQEYSKAELRRIKDSEKTNRKRVQVLDDLSEMIGGRA